MRRKLKRKATFSHSDKVTTLFETFSALLNLKFDFIFHASQFLRSFWSLKLMLDTRSQLLEARKTKLIDTRLDSILEKQKICASDTRKFDTRTPPTIYRWAIKTQFSAWFSVKPKNWEHHFSWFYGLMIWCKNDHIDMSGTWLPIMA